MTTAAGSIELAQQEELQASPEFQAIVMSIAELEQKLLNQDPQMPTYLQRIHTSLLKHPELVHILRDEQRSVILDGLMQQTGIELATVTVSAEKRTRTKTLKSHTEDDI